MDLKFPVCPLGVLLEGSVSQIFFIKVLVLILCKENGNFFSFFFISKFLLFIKSKLGPKKIVYMNRERDINVQNCGAKTTLTFFRTLISVISLYIFI